MSDTPPPKRSPWRDFLNRREPGARWMLVLLVLLLAVELLMLFGYRGDKSTGAAPAHYLPPLVTLAALVTSRWWSLPSAPAFAGPRYEVPTAARAQVWLMAAAVTILSMWPRTVRMNHSLSLAETAKLDIAYRYERENAAPEADDKIEPYGGRRLVWNHVAAQFAVQELDQNPRSNHALNPRTARGLPWVAGILSTGLVVLLAAALGSPRAGLAAGLIAAMHPQLVQASSEVTDAALSQCFFEAALLFLINALRSNAWTWWTALGAAQAALCFGHPELLPAAFGMNVIAAALLWKSPASARDKGAHALRLLVATALAGSTSIIPFSHVLLGFGPPVSLADKWAQFLSGVPCATGGDHSAIGSSLFAITRETIWRWPLLYIMLPLVIGAGLWFLLRQDWRTRIAGIAFALSLVCYGASRGNAPGLLLLPLVMAWAGAGLMRLFPRQPRLLHAPLYVAVIFVMATAPALQRTMSIPRQPLREVLAATHSTPAATVAMFGSGPAWLLARDTDVHVMNGISYLDSLIDNAFDKDTPLLVFHSLADGTDARFVSLARQLESSGQFVLVGEFSAFDPRDNIRLYRYQPREQIINLQEKPEKK